MRIPWQAGMPFRPRPLLSRASLGELGDQPGRERRSRAVGQQTCQFVVDAGSGRFPEDDDVRHLRDD